jgi:hypothetical protein
MRGPPCASGWLRVKNQPCGRDLTVKPNSTLRIRTKQERATVFFTPTALPFLPPTTGVPNPVTTEFRAG